jgi:hypothetical protein
MSHLLSTRYSKNMTIVTTDEKDENEYSNSSNVEQNDSMTLTDGTNSPTQEDSNSSDAIKNRITKTETKQVYRQKVVVVLIMMIASISVCFLVYYITNTAEQDDFHSNFYAATEKVIVSFESLIQKIGSISSIGVAATVYGMDQSESKWPFITLSSFSERSVTARTLSGAILVSLDSYVTEKDRKDYETYVMQSAKTWM